MQRYFSVFLVIIIAGVGIYGMMDLDSQVDEILSLDYVKVSDGRSGQVRFMVYFKGPFGEIKKEDSLKLILTVTFKDNSKLDITRHEIIPAAPGQNYYDFNVPLPDKDWKNYKKIDATIDQNDRILDYFNGVLSTETGVFIRG